MDTLTIDTGTLAPIVPWCRERDARPGDTIVVTHVPTDDVASYTVESIGWTGIVLSDGDEVETWSFIHPDYQFHLVRKAG